MTSSDSKRGLAIQHFADTAQDYCDWLEAEPHSQQDEHQIATRMIACLYANALQLPAINRSGAQATTDTALPILPSSAKKALIQRLDNFPFQYYWEVYQPVTLDPEQPGCGDITEDLADIYSDIKDGLLLYKSGMVEAAAHHWRATFERHWGQHATSALKALHNYTASKVTSPGG